jgi:alanyl-tRNA synthetase
MFRVHRVADGWQQHLASKGITAEQWTAAVTEVIGGKTGGKEPSRQGAASEPHKLEEGVAKAEEWLLEKMKELNI